MNAAQPKLIAILIVLAVTSVGLLYLTATPPSPLSSPPEVFEGDPAAPDPFHAEQRSSAQPKITWSEKSIEVILSPGESTTKELTFANTRDIQDVVLEAVPEIADFLSIQPNGFASVQASQQQAVRIFFSVPENATFGTFKGTIHIRVGSRTLPQTLKVVVNVWRAVSSGELDVSIKVPPEISTLGIDSSSLLSTSAEVVGALILDVAGKPPMEFAVEVFNNPSGLSIDDWFNSVRRFDLFQGENDIVISDTQIGGLPARLYKSEKATKIAGYALQGGKIYALEWFAFHPADAAGMEIFSRLLTTLTPTTQ